MFEPHRAIVGAMALAGVVQPALAQETASYDRLLANYVRADANGLNRVDYARWAANAADRQALKDYIDALERLAPSKMSRNEAFAYWANLYNAVTLDVILENHPVASIRNIRSKGAGLNPLALVGPWKEKFVTVEGRAMSLDDIEHGTMRPTFKDPRVHYAVNCASIGCPNLKTTAWRAETLDADLDDAARAFVNSPRGARVDAQGRVRVSSIYEWFQEDFGGDDAGVLAHLRQYANPALAEKLKAATRIAGHSYDWSINGGAP